MEDLAEGSIMLLGTVATLAYFHFGVKSSASGTGTTNPVTRVLGLIGQFFIAVTFGVRPHVDPLTIACRYAIDSTGHDAVVARLVEKKSNAVRVKGESFMWAHVAESNIISHTREIFPGLIAAGMSANAIAGEHRMGPVFGGMLLSGEHAASLVIRELCR